jgi:hypothetical protein
MPNTNSTAVSKNTDTPARMAVMAALRYGFRDQAAEFYGSLRGEGYDAQAALRRTWNEYRGSMVG